MICIVLKDVNKQKEAGNGIWNIFNTKYAQTFYILGDHPTGCVQGSVEIPFAAKFQM